MISTTGFVLIIYRNLCRIFSLNILYNIISPNSEDIIKYKKFIILHLQNGKFFKSYQLLSPNEPIGDGTFSICMKCVNNDSQEEYAVKILRSNVNVDDEIDALYTCFDCPNIVTIVEVVRDEKFTYIVLELLAGKELFQYIQEQTLEECEVRGIFKEILNAVSYMHSQNIAHRDLKLENIKFISKNPCQSNVKLLDFGFACRTDGDCGMNGLCYTLDYAAPEVLSNKKYTKACDLWSMGVILYTLLCGHSPFRRQNEINVETPNVIDKITKRIKRSSIDENSKFKSLSEPAKDLIRRLLTVSTRSRITLSEILVHDWLNSKPPTIVRANTPAVMVPKVEESSYDNIEIPKSPKKAIDQNRATTKKRKSTRETRNTRFNMKSPSIASTDSVNENATNELYRKISNGIAETIEIPDQLDRSLSIGSTSGDINETFIDQINKDMENLNNNNDKYIDNVPMDIDCVIAEVDTSDDLIITEVTIPSNDSPSPTRLSVDEQSEHSVESFVDENDLNGFNTTDGGSILQTLIRHICLKEFIQFTVQPPTESQIENKRSHLKRKSSSMYSDKQSLKSEGNVFGKQETNTTDTSNNLVFPAVPKRPKRLIYANK